MYASWSGKKDIVKLLLANGANANKKNKNGDTDLMLAEKRGHTHIIRLLKNVDLKWHGNIKSRFFEGIGQFVYSHIRILFSLAVCWCMNCSTEKTFLLRSRFLQIDRFSIRVVYSYIPVCWRCWANLYLCTNRGEAISATLQYHIGLKFI